MQGRNRDRNGKVDHSYERIKKKISNNIFVFFVVLEINNNKVAIFRVVGKSSSCLSFNIAINRCYFRGNFLLVYLEKLRASDLVFIYYINLLL